MHTASATQLVFGNRNLRRVNLGLAGSTVGDHAFATAVAVWAYDVGGGAALGGYGAARLAAIALSLPLSSVLLDRVPHKSFMLAADLIRAILVLIGAMIIWLEGPAAGVFGVAIAAAVVGGPFRPAQMAMLPSLAVTPHELTAANAVSSTLESLAFFLGPAIAGIMLSFSDVPAVFTLNAATFGWSVIMISGVRVRRRQLAAEPEVTAVKSVPSRRQIGAGVGAIAQDRRLQLVCLLSCAQTVISGAAMVFAVVIAVDVLGLGDPGVGLLWSVLGLGAVAGGLLTIARSGRGSAARDFGLGVALWAVPPLLVAGLPHPGTAVAAFAIMGLANPLVDVNTLTLVQRMTPIAVLGRVFLILEAGLMATMALGAFLMPLAVGLVGLRWALVIVAAPILVLVAVCFPAVRRLDQTVVPPEHLTLVRALALFSSLSTSAQEGLAQRLVTLTVPAETTVIRAGDIGDLFYLIERGRLDAMSGTRLLSTMEAGDCFGEIALIRDIPRTATVVAREDSVLQTLSRDDFLHAIGTDHQTALRAEALVNRRFT
jgi:MFS family permease